MPVSMKDGEPVCGYYAGQKACSGPTTVGADGELACPSGWRLQRELRHPHHAPGLRGRPFGPKR